MEDEAKPHSPTCSTLEALVVGHAVRLVRENNWALSVDQCQLQALQFSVHLINLLSIFLRCNSFTGIQKALVDQVGSRQSDSDHDLFLVKVWLWGVLWSFFNH